MRNLTPNEVATLNSGHCPLCGGIDFKLGPRGGMMQNVRCTRCTAVFNVVTAEARSTYGALPVGQLLNQGPNDERNS
jgi:hypothetical protein